MNTTDELRAEFDRLAALAPNIGSLRATVAERTVARERRRRRSAILAVAASVVTIAGGIAVGTAVLRSDPVPARPAAPPAVVTVPEIPLPDGTALIRHQLEPVVSPVAATPPAGLTGINWTNGPGRLSVAYFDPADLTGSGAAAEAAGGDSATVGYAITDGPDDVLTVAGESGGVNAPTETRDITVAGHPAVLTTAAAGALDPLGLRASERISWQLADGSYIHLWAAGMATRDSSPSTAVVEFAESVVERPTVLRRTVGIGLTLPGFTVDTSTNIEPVAGYVGGSLWLCVDGVDPLDPATQAMVSNEAGPRESAMARGCLVAAVINGGTYTDLYAQETIVNGREIRVSTQYSTAFADLGHGLTGVVTAPTGFGQVYDEPVDHDRVVGDLAALAASITLAPDVEILPFDLGPAGSSQDSSGGSAAPAPNQSAKSHPPPRTIEFPEGGETDVTVNPDAKTVRLQFPLRNASDETVEVNTITVTGEGLTQLGIAARLDNLPSDVDTAFQPVDRPIMFAPGSQVQLRVTVRADQCPLASSGPDAGWLEITVDYSDGVGGGQIGTRAVTDGWADALCG